MESHCDQSAACDAAGMKQGDAAALGKTVRRYESRPFVAVCRGMARDGAGCPSHERTPWHVNATTCGEWGCYGRRGVRGHRVPDGADAQRWVCEQGRLAGYRRRRWYAMLRNDCM